MFRGMIAFLLLVPQIVSAKSILATLEKETIGIVKKVSPSIVVVQAHKEGGDETFASTGFVYDKSGHIVTQYRPVADAREVTVVLRNGKQYEADLVAGDDFSNIAVLKIEKGRATPVSFGSAKNVAPGSWAIVLSSSYGLSPCISIGILNGKREDGMLHISAPVSPGGSGGVIVDPAGRVIGIVKAGLTPGELVRIYTESEDISIIKDCGILSAPSDVMLAYPVEEVREIVKKLIKEGGIDRGYLGVYLTNPGEEEGALVTDIVENSPAEDAGIEGGDIIKEIDGQSMKNYKSVVKYIGERKSGAEVKITLLRDGKEKIVTAKLVKRKKMMLKKRVFTIPRIEELEDLGECFEEWGEELGEYFKDFSWHWEKGEDRVFLGVYLQDLSPELAEYFGVVKGALITDVVEDSPAEGADLKDGDVIVEIDGEEVEDSYALKEALNDRAPGGKVKIKIIRHKKEKVFEIELGGRKGKSYKIKKIQKIIPGEKATTSPKEKKI